MENMITATAGQFAYIAAQNPGEPAQEGEQESEVQGGGEVFVKMTRAEYDDLLNAKQELALRKAKDQPRTLQQNLATGDEMLMELEQDIVTYGFYSKKLDEKYEQQYYQQNREYLAQHPDAVVEIGPGEFSNQALIEKMLSEKPAPLQTWVFKK